jgi:hypothetical protein
MKVETDINTRTTVSLDTTSCDTSDNVCWDLLNGPYCFFYHSRHNVFDTTLTDNFQYQGQFIDTENIRLWDLLEKCTNFWQN